MRKLIVLLALAGVCYAGDYKSCVIEYKTDAGLCQQIEKVLNVVVDSTVTMVETNLWPVKEGWDTSYVVISRTIRQYCDLMVVCEPDYESGYLNDSSDSMTTWYKHVRLGKAIMIWKEVEK